MSIFSSCCRACGEGSLTQKSRIRDISYKNTVLKVKEEFLECEICGAQPSITSMIKEHRRKVLAAKKSHDGLLSAQDIRQIRNDLDIDQNEAYRLFGGGPTAFSKYENNDVIQSEAMDTLLRLAHMNKNTFRDLKALRSMQSSLKRGKLRVLTNIQYENQDDAIETSKYAVSKMLSAKKSHLKFLSSSEIESNNTFTRIAV